MYIGTEMEIRRGFIEHYFTRHVVTLFCSQTKREKKALSGVKFNQVVTNGHGYGNPSRAD